MGSVGHEQTPGDEEGLSKLTSESRNNENNNLFESTGNDLSSGEIEVIDSGTQGHSMGHNEEEAIMRKMGD